MSEIKLVLTDMDGTIVPTMSNNVSEVVHQSIKAIEAKGVTVSAVSARPYSVALPVLSSLEINGPCVLDGGASVIDAVNGEILWQKWLEPQQVKQIVSILLPSAYQIEYTTDHVAVEDTDTIIIDEIVESAPYVYAIIPDREYDMTVSALNGIQEIGAHRITIDQPDKIGIQITHIEANKRHGVTALQDIVGIPAEQTLAIGDGDNDRPLFENAAVKVAMGNATQDLKQRADHIVGTVDEDGFAEAMRSYVL